MPKAGTTPVAKPKPNHNRWTPRHLKLRLRTDHDVVGNTALVLAANQEDTELLEFVQWAEDHAPGMLDAPNNLVASAPNLCIVAQGILEPTAPAVKVPV
jgi:hypothetical protein